MEKAPATFFPSVLSVAFVFYKIRTSISIEVLFYQIPSITCIFRMFASVILFVIA